MKIFPIHEKRTTNFYHQVFILTHSKINNVYVLLESISLKNDCISIKIILL